MPNGEEAGNPLGEKRPESEQQQEEARRSRLIVGYAVVSTVVLAIAVLVFILASGGGGEESGPAKDAGGAHINFNVEIGSTNGILPDRRAGTVPPPAQEEIMAAAAKRAGCELKLRLKDEGHGHLPPATEVDYGTNPPTSGNHVEPPFQQADGAYLETPDPLNVVHALEHGRMAIQYSPDLAEEEQLELKGLYDTMYGATLLFPNPEMPYEVAATTWTNLLGCPTYEGSATLDAIRAFGMATWGKFGGEPVFAFTFTGPTPAEPAAPQAAE